MNTDQCCEDVKREEFLVVPMLDERARPVEDPRRWRPMSGIPDPIGFWRDSKLGSER